MSRLTELADHIEKLDTPDHFQRGLARGLKVPDLFYMATFYSPLTCGTAACIAGHAVGLWGVHAIGEYTTQAQEILSLTEKQANDLFVPALGGLVSQKTADRPVYSDVTPAMAAWLLRTLDATGNIDWDGAFQRKKELG